MWQLRDDSLAELVTGVAVGKRQGDVGVQALQLPRIARAADAEVERRAHVGAGAGGRELAADGALLLRRVLQAMGELGIVGDPLAPALDSACRLQRARRRRPDADT